MADVRQAQVEEINRRLKERGFAPGELQATMRGLRGDHLAPFTREEIELGLLDAFANMGGATVWAGDGSSCAAQIVEHLVAELQAKLEQAERDVKEVQAAREWIANKTGVGGGLRPLSFLISSHEYMAQERAAAQAQRNAAESALAAAQGALREARATLLEYRTCGRCAHTYAQHSGHTYSPPYPEPHHCSRADGCMEFMDGFRHPVFRDIDAALAAESGKPGRGLHTITDGLHASGKPGGEAPTEAQIKHMVNRFLGWKLPHNFSPDAGISFKPTYNEHTPWPDRHAPVGTNLLDATQAEAMVRHMIEGMPATEPRAAPQPFLPSPGGEAPAPVCRDCGAIVYRGMCDRCGGNGSEPGEAKKEEGT